MRQTKETGSPGRPARTTQKINSHRFGSVTNNKGYIGLDFYYLGERIRAGFNGLRHTERNAREARIFLDRIGAQMQNHTFRFREHFPDHPKAMKLAAREGSPATMPGDITFKAYADSYFQRNKDLLSPTQKERFESILRVHLIPVFGHMTFAEITRLPVKNFVRDLQLGTGVKKTQLKGATIRNIFTVFRKIINEAVSDFEWDDWRDPFRGVKLPSLNTRKTEPFTLEEWEKIKAELPAWYVSYFTFALLSGMRTSEICGLKWEDISTDVIRVRRANIRGKICESTKTEKSRRDVKMRLPLKKVLDAQRQIVLNSYPDSEFVFISNEGRPISSNHHWKVWQRACARAGVKHRKPYALRHTMISHAIKSGEDLQWLKTQTGHTDTTMFVRNYWQYINTQDRDDGGKLDKQLEGAEDSVDEIAVQLAVQGDPRTLRGRNTLKTKDFLKYARRDSKTFRTNDAR